MTLDIVAQVNAAHERALVVPAPEYAALVVTGADRATWLNGLVTCDVARLRPGDAAYGLAVAQKGRILTELVIVVDAERVHVVLPRSQVETVRAAFDRYLIMEDAEMAGDAVSPSVFFVHGPAAREALEAARAAGAAGGAVDFTGLGGAVVIASQESEEIVRARLGQVGTIGDDAGWNALRLERGVPRFGVDFDGTMYPQEASLEKRAVSFDKGCYLGQEVVCMLEMRGHVKRKIVPLAIEGASVPEKGAAVVTPAGEHVGEVTSATKLPRSGSIAALAMVKYAHARSGEELRVGGSLAKVV